jgi:hypothetical protein
MNVARTRRVGRVHARRPTKDMNIVSILMITAGIAIAAPIVAAVMVSVASRREDARCTLAGPARGHIDASARRILGFSFDGDWPRRSHRG